MKINSIFKTINNNKYMYSQKGQFHIFTSPLLAYFIENMDIYLSENDILPLSLKIDGLIYKKEDIEYYHKKYLFFKKYCLIEELDEPGFEMLSGRVDESAIKWRLINLSNVTFEVTNCCNLECHYCAYGELYNDHGQRNNRNLSFDTAKLIIDYLMQLWKEGNTPSIRRKVAFGFYGGEPLLNMEIVKKIIEYIEDTALSIIIPHFNMTTNGTLLDRHIEYIVKKNIKLLISLDGNKENNSHRVFKNGNSTFDLVFKNINLVRNKYPDFFKSNCRFNAVLHNKNSVNDIYSFFLKEFEIKPRISEITSSGIDPDKCLEYERIFKSTFIDLYQSHNIDELSNEIDLDNPIFRFAVFFLHQYSGNFYNRYTELLYNGGYKKSIPSSTCYPFERKLFITANGEILPCERISSKHLLGKVNRNKVELDFANVAAKYNNYFNNIVNLCAKCYGFESWIFR